MRVESFSKIEDIPLDRASWNAMVQNNETNTVFQTWEWFHSWWKNYGSKHELVFLIAYQGDRKVGFVPLMRSKQSYGQKILHFAGDTNADYCDFVIETNHLQAIDAFLRHLYSGAVGWTSMLLLNIPDQSTSIACLRTICHKNNYNIQIKLPVPAPTLYIKNHRQDALATVNKYSVTRHLRKIEKLGNIEFRNLHRKDEILPFIELFFNQHIDRYKLKKQTSQFADTTSRQFYMDLLENFSDTGWLVFSMLLLNGKPIAFHLGFQYNDRMIWYKPAFDVDYRNYSPGTIMLKFLVEYTIDTGNAELDFTIGNEDFKSRFCNRIRYNQNIAIYRSRLMLFIFMLRRFVGYILQGTSGLFRKHK